MSHLTKMSSSISGSVQRMCSTLTLAVDGTHTANVICVHQMRPAVSNLKTLRRDVSIDLGVLMVSMYIELGERSERGDAVYIGPM